MKQSLHNKGKTIFNGTPLYLSVVLVCCLFLLCIGCIPEKMVVTMEPGSKSAWETDVTEPEKKPDTVAADTKVKVTENFYVGVMDVDLNNKISPDFKMPLTNTIIGELVSMNKFRVVDRGNRDALLEEMGFQQSGCTDDTCTVEVGRLLGVNRMVFGTISLIGNKYTINIQVLNVETGQIEGTSEKSIVCKEEDLLGWVKLTTRELFK